MVSPSAEVCPHCGAKYPASYIPSKVTVHRMSGVLGFGVGMTVTIDGEKVGELRKNGDAITFSLPYGDYTLKGLCCMNMGSGRSAPTPSAFFS